MNRRQFLTSIPMMGAAIVAAPAVALAAKPSVTDSLNLWPDLAMGGTLTPGTPYLVGESIVPETLYTIDARGATDPAVTEAAIRRALMHPAYYPKFNASALLRGDATHKA